MSFAVRLGVPLNTSCSSRCHTPMRSRVSWRDADRTHAPNATERTPGMYSESTVSPLGITVRLSPVPGLAAPDVTTWSADSLHVHRARHRRRRADVSGGRRHDPDALRRLPAR